MITLVSGNLIRMAEDGQFDYVVHGANCFCVMGAGIARQIARRYPEAEAADDATGCGDYEKIGTWSEAVVRSIVNPTITFTIINAYTQFAPAAGADVFEYGAFRKFCHAFNKAVPHGSRIGLPKIGAGLAGGDWDQIESIIVDELIDHEVVVVDWDQTFV